MSDSRILLKPVNSLLVDANGTPTKFLIPAYQRGYRWSPIQVTQLLDDIWEFIQTNDTGLGKQFYCLQPLVIKLSPGGAFEVVDGQQRLTTLFIILTYLKELVSVLDKVRFQLTFATREMTTESFLEQIELSRADENVDFFHICEAYRSVEAWFKKRDSSHKLKLLQHLLNDDEAGRNVKVIWFQLAESDDPVAAFTRLNVGKIPLTNDELIRALFLRRSSRENFESTQLRIANEWDMIEKGLQSDSFWYFLNNQSGPTQNRIGFLFELLARSDGLLAGIEHDTYGIFYAYNNKLKATGADTEYEWRRVKQAYMGLEEWYEDRVLYHIIGFLISQKVDLMEIQRLSKNCAKSDFEQKLRAKIFSKVIGGELPETEEEIRDCATDALEELEYGRHSGKIRSLLLLFNLTTLLQNNKSNIRFQFDSFKTERWDLEHVKSVATDRPERYQDRISWLDHCLGYLKAKGGDEPFIAEIETFRQMPKLEVTDENFDPLYGKLLTHFQEANEEEADNRISNLTLLDEQTNRSYKNAVFAVKRQRVLSLDQAGIFVPLCTRNVFLKCYSPQVDNAMFWGTKDREAYQSAILESLVGFFSGKGGNPK